MTNGRKRQPVNLILANGKHHFSRKELEERRARELDVPFKKIKAPSYLTATQKKNFNAYAEKLMELDIFTELDVDVLAQYVIALELYTKYSAQIRKLVNQAEPVKAWDAINSITQNCEDAEMLVDLLEKLVRRQRASELSALTTLQDKAFKQCLACARELGLSITSRAKIEVPPPADGGEDDEL
jgi:P27 family predicted phage terminase small subunit